MPAGSPHQARNAAPTLAVAGNFVNAGNVVAWTWAMLAQGRVRAVASVARDVVGERGMADLVRPAPEEGAPYWTYADVRSQRRVVREWMGQNQTTAPF